MYKDYFTVLKEYNGSYCIATNMKTYTTMHHTTKECTALGQNVSLQICMRNKEVENKNVKKNFTMQEKTGHIVNEFAVCISKKNNKNNIDTKSYF